MAADDFDDDDDLFADDDETGERAASLFGVAGLLLSDDAPEASYAEQLAAKPDQLALNGRQIGDAGLGELVMALNGENGQNLTRLAIEDNGISDAGADALWQACAAEKLPQLTELFMSRNNIGDTGIFAALASSIAQGGFAKLGALDLNSNRLGDRGLRALGASASNLGSLRSLYLDRNGIGDAGLTDWSNALVTASQPGAGALPSLYELWLSNNNIGDAGVASLFDALGKGAAPSLGDLRLQYNQIGDAGVQSLVNVLQSARSPYESALCNAWYFGLSDNTLLTDEGLRALKGAIEGGGLPRLEFLTMTAPQTSEAMEKELQDALTRRRRR